jgi:hypothetical protein
MLNLERLLEGVDCKFYFFFSFDRVAVFENNNLIESGVVYRGTWNQTEVALKVMKNAGKFTPRPAVSTNFLSVF